MMNTHKGERSMTDDLRPTVGAAMPIDLLAQYGDWLIEGQRDIEIQDAFRPAVLDGDWRSLVSAARSALDGYRGRIGIHGPFDGLTLMSRDPRVRALVSERLCSGLEFGADLGATHMVIHSPFVFFGSPFVPHSPSAGRAEQIGPVHATLEKVLPFARQLNCTLVIENIFDTNPAPLLALVESFDSEHVRMSLDTGHAFLTQRIGGPPPDQWVREAGVLLGHLHLQDNDGHLDRHWAPGDGNINWMALFEALAEIQQRPRMIIEVRNYQDISRAEAWFVQRGLAR
jgi:sugar phosphate isomerase/epimerase